MGTRKNLKKLRLQQQLLLLRRRRNEEKLKRKLRLQQPKKQKKRLRRQQERLQKKQKQQKIIWMILPMIGNKYARLLFIFKFRNCDQSSILDKYFKTHVLLKNAELTS